MDTFQSTRDDIVRRYTEEPVRPDTLNDKLAREADLWRGLPGNAVAEAQRTIREEPGKAAVAGTIGLVAGAGLAALTRNPGLLGARAMPYVREALHWAPWVGGGATAVDLGVRVGVPSYMTWNDARNHEASRQLLAQNIGSGMVEYTAGAVGGIAGASAAWRMTRPWQNQIPEFDPKPSLTVGQKPRQVENPDAFITTKENSVADDVAALYEKSFPAEERQPLDEVKELVASGRILVHTTREADGRLHSFSFTSMHDETSMKFANLDFIATETGDQSRGVGSLHAQRINQLISAERKDLTAMTLEMEAVAEPDLPPDVLATRQRRAMYYQRLDAPDTNVRYNILDFNDPAYRGPAEWRAWIWKPEEFHPVHAARLMMTDEGGYGLASRSIQVREFDLANNFYLPERGAGTAAATGTGLTGLGSTIVNSFRRNS